MKRAATAIVCVGAVALAGCGGSGGKRKATRPSTAATPRAKSASPARRQYLLFGLNELGWIDGNCADAHRFQITLTVPANYATDEVRFSVAGQLARKAWVDPGRSLTWSVRATETGTRSQPIVGTPPIEVRIVQPTEPHILTATVRMRVLQWGAYPGECLVRPGSVQQSADLNIGP